MCQCVHDYDVLTRLLLIKVKMYIIIQILDKIVLVELGRDI